MMLFFFKASFLFVCPVEIHAGFFKVTKPRINGELYSKGMLKHMELKNGIELPRMNRSTEPAAKTNASCQLPHGARWCSAWVNGKQRSVAVYSGPDPVSNVICEQGYWEFGSVQGLGLHQLGHGKTLIDIGANIGWFSVIFADAGYFVYAIEPMVENRKLISATLCQNPDLTSNIEIVPVALAQKPTRPGETCDVYSCDCNLGDGLLVCDGEESRRDFIVNHPNFRHVWRESVNTMTLDQLMKDKGNPPVNVMKMDVEGYECKIIEGGLQTFRKPNYIMAEVRADTSQCTILPLTRALFEAHTGTFEGPVVNSAQVVGAQSHENLFFVRSG